MTTAMIIGGGVAGPVAAMALQRAGIDSVIHEAHPGGAEDVGAFLTLQSNGMDALRAVDAHRVVAQLGVSDPRDAFLQRHRQVPGGGSERRHAAGRHRQPHRPTCRPAPGPAGRGAAAGGAHRVRQAARRRAAGAVDGDGDVRGRQPEHGRPAGRLRRHPLTHAPGHRPVRTPGAVRAGSQHRRLRPWRLDVRPAGGVLHGLRQACVLRVGGRPLRRDVVVRESAAPRRADGAGTRRDDLRAVAQHASGVVREGPLARGGDHRRNARSAARLGDL